MTQDPVFPFARTSGDAPPQSGPPEPAAGDHATLPGGAIPLRELHHRLQNTLSMVLALSRITARSAPTLAEFQKAFGDRVGAMARMNDLLLQGDGQTVKVAAALEAELRSHLAEEGQVTLGCEEMALPSEAGLRLSLILHEMASNAVAYGALSHPGGRLAIECRRTADGAELQWRETLASPLAESALEGGGLQLVRRLTRSLGGSASIELRSAGMDARFTFRVNEPERG